MKPIFQVFEGFSTHQNSHDRPLVVERFPLRRLKFLPWQSLFQAAFLTVMFVVGLEFLLSVGRSHSPVVERFLAALLAPPMGVIISLVIAFGVGALAVAILERLNSSAINTNTLWAMVLCLAIAFLVKRWLPIIPFLFDFGSLPLALMMVGVFWRGQAYWSSTRRW
jgi:hypothetical protein